VATERDLLMIRLFAEGVTTSQIGEQVGWNKNMVVGRLGRLRDAGYDVPKKSNPSVHHFWPQDPDERDLQMIDLYHTLSAAEIGCVVGLTRQQVAGRLMRLRRAGHPVRSKPFGRQPGGGQAAPATPRPPARAAMAGGDAIALRQGATPRPPARPAIGAGVATTGAKTGRQAPIAPPSFAAAPPEERRPPAPPRVRTIPECCWPIGEPGTREFRFCDAPAIAPKPYCEQHIKRAFVRVRDRDEDRAAA
jgi:GcrA cell cycle regulator